MILKAKAFSIFVVSIPTLIFPYLMERSTMEIWNFGLNMVFWRNVNILVNYGISSKNLLDSVGLVRIAILKTVSIFFYLVKKICNFDNPIIL